MDDYILDQLVSKIRSSNTKHVDTVLDRFQRFFPISYDHITKEDVAVRKREVEVSLKQKKYLDGVPLVEQRSPEWYALRRSMLTASDWGQALGVGKYGTVTQLYHNKCEYGDAKPFDSTMPALAWGVRYEPVATDIYALKTNTIVSEYGVMRHPEHDFLGASPDGISSMGVMLEIKCLWRRKIDGKIPDQYLYQVQGQLETCNMELCDYFECVFEEFDTLEELRASKSGFRGIVLLRKDGSYHYGQVNDLSTLASYDTDVYTRAYYYRLKECMMRRVRRDREWFQQMLPELRSVWDNIVRYRNNKEDYDAEVKRPTKRSPTFKMRGMASPTHSSLST
jgi:putative phage-type endonuclease